MDKEITSASIMTDSAAAIELSDKGYTLFPLLGKSETEALKNYYSDFQKEEPQNFYASTHSPDFAFRKKTSDFIKQTIEPLLANHLQHYNLLGGAFVVKPAHGKGILQAHQDWNLVDESRHSSYNLWIPLTDVTENNGTIFVLPESHRKTTTIRGPQIPSPFKNIEQELWRYLTPVPMKSGSAMLYNHALLHGSPPNNSPTSRLVIVIGIVKKGSNLQVFGNDEGVVKSYTCDENFFLTKNTLTDFVTLPVKTTITIPQKEYTLTEFEALFTNSKSNEREAAVENSSRADNRSFFEKYSVKNIIAEINYRLSKPENKTGQASAINQTEASKKDVAKFYNEQTDNFLKVYGNVIQAFRTKDVSVLLNYQMETMGLKEGMNVLDAGCGVCGPAIYFAKHSKAHIDAVTISSVQEKKSKLAIAENGLNDKITVITGDFHLLENHYPANHFDVIYFLESFGHATDHTKVLDSAWKVLKPGGLIYIKDLFRKKSANPKMELGIEKEIQNINTAYHYNVPDLNSILDHVRGKGYILSSVKTIDIPLQDFENLTISNDFQELTGINKIETLRDYVFPVDFFELKLIKPNFDVAAGNSRYFMQNMYFMQIENWKENEL